MDFIKIVNGDRVTTAERRVLLAGSERFVDDLNKVHIVL